MRKVYNFLVITITLAFIFMLGCIGWFNYIEPNMNILFYALMAGLYGLFMGVAAISLEVDLIAEGK